MKIVKSWIWNRNIFVMLNKKEEENEIITIPVEDIKEGTYRKAVHNSGIGYYAYSNITINDNKKEIINKFLKENLSSMIKKYSRNMKNYKAIEQIKFVEKYIPNEEECLEFKQRDIFSDAPFTREEYGELYGWE